MEIYHKSEISGDFSNVKLQIYLAPIFRVAQPIDYSPATFGEPAVLVASSSRHLCILPLEDAEERQGTLKDAGRGRGTQKDARRI